MAWSFRIISIITALMFIASCDDDSPNFEIKDDDGVVTFKSELWRTPTAQEGGINFTAGVFTPVYKDMFISTINLGDQTEIAAFDVNTGEIRWRWRDFIGNDANLILIDIPWPYTHQNRLIFQSGNRSYCIDMDTGQTIWKQEDNIANTHSHLNGYEDRFLKTISPVEYDGEMYGLDYIYDVDGNQLRVIPPQDIESLDSTNQDFISASSGGTLFKHQGKEYLVSVSGQADEVWNAYAFLGIYNITDSEWVYSGRQMLEPARSRVADGFPVVTDNVVINSVDDFICVNDLWTGDSLWVKEHSGNFLFGGFFIHEGCIYALAEADALYCYDLLTGDECWRMDDDGLGTASRMVHMNGVIYFRSGGNGRLMAVDMETGELLWNLRSPDAEIFMPDVAVYPGENGEKGKVLAATYLGALCYEAIR